MRALSVSQHEKPQHNERQPRVIHRLFQSLAEHEIREQRLNERRAAVPHGVHPNDVLDSQHSYQEINNARISHTALNEQRDAIHVIVGGTRVRFELEVAVHFHQA